MSPAAKFNTLLASTTVTIMYFLLVNGASLLQQLSGTYSAALAVGALVASAGLYRLMSVGMRWLMERWQWLNEKVLGASYMHGTWLGWFEGHTKEKRYMVEHFVQDLDSLVITGRSFTAEEREHGYWESESCTIDARKGRLIFTYKFDVLTQKHALLGIHSSLFERKSAHHAPSGISGFAHDLNDDVRIAVHSRKVSRKLLPWDKALKRAVQLYDAQA